MGHWMVVAGAGLAIMITALSPVAVNAQATRPDVPAAGDLTGTARGPDSFAQDSRWELSLAGFVGRPSGYIRVGENALRGTRLRLHEDLGIDVSEAVEGSAAFHFTRRDAVRATYVYYFLDGRGLLDRSIVYNGEEFTSPGHVTTNADFYRLSLAYERLVDVPGGSLTGSLGLGYVHMNPTLTAHGRSNSEDFYRQELPVPIVGLRFDVPLGGGFGARASLSGGGLPRIDSGRREGGTVYLEQIHGEASLALTYSIAKTVLLDAGPHITYLFQHEKSHEDNNAFELIDVGARVGVTFRF